MWWRIFFSNRRTTENWGGWPRRTAEKVRVRAARVCSHVAPRPSHANPPLPVSPSTRAKRGFFPADGLATYEFCIRSPFGCECVCVCECGAGKYVYGKMRRRRHKFQSELHFGLKTQPFLRFFSAQHTRFPASGRCSHRNCCGAHSDRAFAASAHCSTPQDISARCRPPKKINAIFWTIKPCLYSHEFLVGFLQSLHHNKFFTFITHNWHFAQHAANTRILVWPGKERWEREKKKLFFLFCFAQEIWGEKLCSSDAICLPNNTVKQ